MYFCRFGLAGRPERHPLHDARSAQFNTGTGKFRHALFAHERRPHLSARVRRTNVEIRRRRAGAQDVRGRRRHRSLHAAHSVRSSLQAQRQIFHRVLRPGFAHVRRRMPRRHYLVSRDDHRWRHIEYHTTKNLFIQ